MHGWAGWKKKTSKHWDKEFWSEDKKWLSMSWEMKVSWLNLPWFAQNCSLRPDEEDSSEVFFFCFFFCLYTVYSSSYGEKLIIKTHTHKWFCVKLNEDYRVFTLVPRFVSSRRMLPRCGRTTPSVTGRRCVRWWGASTLGPSPSTELWATSPQGITGSKHHATSGSAPTFQSAPCQRLSFITAEQFFVIPHYHQLPTK